MKKPRRPKLQQKSAPTRRDIAEFVCPVCWQKLQIPVDRSAGERQSFVYDCEVCCRPLVITIQIDEDIHVDARAE